MKAIFLILTLIFMPVTSNAGLLNPFISPINLNIGLDYAKPMINNFASANQENAAQHLFKGENMNLYAGLRLFRFIGAEVGYTNFNGNSFKKNSQTSDMQMHQTYMDAKLYIPMLNLRILTAEIYGSFGLSDLSGSFYNQSTLSSENISVKNATKIGGGLEFSILKTISARLGYYQINEQIPALENNKISAYYGGFSIYLI